MLIETVYVNDFLVFSNNKKLVMKDLGVANYCLGVLYLDQENCIEAMLERFQMSNCNAMATPFEPGLKLDDVVKNKGRRGRMCPTRKPRIRLTSHLALFA